MLVNSKFEWTEHICDINQDFSGETTPQYIIPPRDINFDFDGKIVNCQVNLYRVHDRPTIKINVSKAGVNISLYLPAWVGEQYLKIGISGEEFLKFSCKMLHFVNTQKRKDDLNE